MAAFATSYIQTVAATVTRNADVASMTGANFSSWYRADEGGLYAEYQTVDLGASRFSAMFSISDGTTNNRIQMSHASNGQRRYVVSVNSVAQVDTSTGNAQGTDTSGVFAKFGAAYKVNDFAGVVNGAAAVTDTSGTIPVVDRAFIGAAANGGDLLNGTIKKLAFYPRRIANDQLQGITTV
jgi:hypothetical protein